MKTIKIFGAPGCGKTTKMLELLERELQSGTRLNRICFVTATVAARDEAKARARRLLPHASDKEFQYFRTIHGICFGELHLGRDNVMQTEDYLNFGEQYGLPFSSQYSRELDEDGLPDGFAHSPGNDILSIRQLAAAWMANVMDHKVLERATYAASIEQIQFTLTKYADYKRIATKFDFVDMLQLYMDDKMAPLPIDVLFLDEGQDLSRLQWAVVDKFAAQAQRRYVAGDDDQSIYGFIGADPLGFYHLPADEVIVLPKTYRLRRNIWNFARKIIEPVKDRVAKHIEVFGEGGSVEYCSIDPSYIDYEHEEIMVIARHHTQLSGIARDLEKRGIPFRHRGQSLTGTDRAKAVYWFLQLKAGKNVRLQDAAGVVKHSSRDGHKRFAELARTSPDDTIRADGIREYGPDVSKPWATQFGSKRRDHFQNEGIAAILRENGPDTLIRSPRVELTTYHASKGREAKSVVLFTNCYQAAWDSGQLNPDDERRLAYVGATRAKEKLTIVAPTSDMYMRSLV